VGYDHSIEEGITIDPPIPLAEIPADHPLHPRHHPVCINRRTGAPVPPTVYGHQECVLAPDLVFAIDGDKAHAIVPATHLGHKLGAPVRGVEAAVATFGEGRDFDGHLLFRGDDGETWTIEVVNGRVEVADEWAE
jgi:hypothetical protein